jgi:hypothetical protein
MIMSTILESAKQLALDHVRNEPTISEIYLFPADNEIRLVEVAQDALPWEREFAPFYFQPDPQRGIPFPSGIALIRPEDKHQIQPPSRWGNWEQSILIWPEASK